jgi:hypothetical protein
LQQAGGGVIADEQRHPDGHGDADDGQDQAADHVAGEHGGSPDAHGLEAGDDALGHVLGHRDRGGIGGAHDGEEENARRQEVDVGAASPARGDPVAQRAAEDVDEQQQEDDGPQDWEQRQAGVPLEVAQVAPHHRARIV